mmetsp:Transcript_78391/g.151420  ORF Transcript_78391/g.151420 Transcript_78391/m.151420 type:complete len:214 (+) Transcript_78391:195-836(+)
MLLVPSAIVGAAGSTAATTGAIVVGGLVGAAGETTETVRNSRETGLLSSSATLGKVVGGGGSSCLGGSCAVSSGHAIGGATIGTIPNSLPFCVRPVCIHLQSSRLSYQSRVTVRSNMSSMFTSGGGNGTGNEGPSASLSFSSDEEHSTLSPFLAPPGGAVFALTKDVSSGSPSSMSRKVFLTRTAGPPPSNWGGYIGSASIHVSTTSDEESQS